MKSDVIRIEGTEDRTAEALDQAERVAVFEELGARDALHLRLLAEEMMNMVRAIAGTIKGEFWIVNSGKLFELHLHARTAMDFQKHDQLLASSSSGKNEAVRGFMGKVRAFFEPTETLYPSFNLTPDGVDTDMVWTMRAYQQQIRENIEQNLAGSAEAWDELERSVVSHIADDVKVSIRGCDVEMTVSRKLA